MKVSLRMGRELGILAVEKVGRGEIEDILWTPNNRVITLAVVLGQ